ncbi:MAG: hypothetical protein MRJ92_12810 [Nitrospira sp.]|nr:hypothetical protein [Nitrospira sp.]
MPIVASNVVGNRDVLSGWCAHIAANDTAAAAAQWRVATDASLRAELIETGRHVRQTEFPSRGCWRSWMGCTVTCWGQECRVCDGRDAGAAVPRCAVTSYSAELPLPG